MNPVQVNSCGQVAFDLEGLCQTLGYFPEINKNTYFTAIN